MQHCWSCAACYLTQNIFVEIAENLTSLRLFLSFILILPLGTNAIAQRQTPKQYIEKYDQDAVAEMLKSGVPASITLSQGMLESDYGNSDLAKNAKNHFGIKCHSSWTGKRTYKDDDAKGECFRVYPSVYDSYVDHSDFLHRNRRYAFLFDLKRTDYKGWAKGLKKAGYATNPKYPDLLIKIIEENELWKYDKMDKNDLKSLGGSAKGAGASSGGAVAAGAGGSSSAGGSGSSSGSSGRGIQISKNKIKYVVAKGGDTPGSIAKSLNMGAWQIKKYNGFKKGQQLKPGTVVYLQPKRRKYKGDQKEHTVVKGEGMWDISQKYGVKLKRLYKMNRMERNTPLRVGQKLRIR